MSDPNNYTVGWISAIEIEYAAAQEFLDEEHEGPERVHQKDENHYTLGRIGKHNVAIAVLPRGDNGVAAAALAAKDMMHTFPNIRVCLMVGIGGGAPSTKYDIRLRDVVVSVPTFAENGGNQGGVVQYDYGRTIQKRCFQGARYLNRPPRALLAAVTGLSTKFRRKGNNINKVVGDILQNNERLKKEYGRPDQSSDKLYPSDPPQMVDSGENLALKPIERPKRSEKEDNPAIHHGLIASTDGFMEDAEIRDILAEELDVLCFEMEAAGLMNSFPCLVIRGICDYSDRHWFKEWRGYAAMTAAAYANALLQELPEAEINKMQTIKDLLPPDMLRKAKNFIAPLWGDKKQVVVSVSETKTTDRSGDQSHQPTPDQKSIIQSPNTGDDGSGEALVTDINDDQNQMLPTQATKLPLANMDATSGQTEIKHVYIAVMGVTGSGKSSLISLCTGKYVNIGHNLNSCTADVEDVEFMLNDHVCVHLIDTPGFDDTNRSDAQVLQEIAYWLSESFKHGTHLSGMIYLHRITDVRMAGSARRNLVMFQKLCGKKAYKSVVLATTMWELIDEATGVMRERELKDTEEFWGCMHDKGSRIFRLDNTRESCLEIVQHILSFESTVVLQLQHEIVNKGRQIEETKAGVQLNEDIIRERKRHQAELQDLKNQMQEEMVQHDAMLQRILKEECNKLEETIRLHNEEQAKLKQDLREVQERKELEFFELKMQIEADRKKHEDKSRKQQEALDRHAREQKAWVNKGDTPLHLAALDGDADVITLLLDEEADTEAKNKDGLTPLHYASENGHFVVAKLLLDRGANIEAKTLNRSTPLHYASRDGEAEIARLLLKQGAKIEAKDKDGSTPLHDVSWNGQIEVARLLLDRGANTEARGKNRSTPLHDASRNGKADVVELLLDRGANITSRDFRMSTPHGVAQSNKQEDVAELLISRGAKK